MLEIAPEHRLIVRPTRQQHAVRAGQCDIAVGIKRSGLEQLLEVGMPQRTGHHPGKRSVRVRQSSAYRNDASAGLAGNDWLADMKGKNLAVLVELEIVPLGAADR